MEAKSLQKVLIMLRELSLEHLDMKSDLVEPKTREMMDIDIFDL